MNSKKLIILTVLLLCSFLLMGQQGVVLSLRLNDANKLTIYRNEPLLINLYITNPKASADEQWNLEADAGLLDLEEQHHSGKITDEKFNAEKQQIEEARKKDQTAMLGSDEIPVVNLVQVLCKNIEGDTIHPPLKLLNGRSIPAQFILDGSAYYTLQWGIDRMATQNLKPGKYFFTATIGDYHSNFVELVVQPGSIPSSRLNTVSMQSALGRFALMNEKPDSAIVHAKTILKMHPTSIDGLVLLGDAYVQKKNYSEALKNFQFALLNFKKQYPRSPEPPEYIVNMIQQLKDHPEN